MPTNLEPSPNATGVLQLMIDRDDIQRTIIEETLDAKENGQILESGRTLCSAESRVKGPLERFPRAVDLQQCPVSGMGGAWHTHVTPRQLMRPENSLPDVAAVVFGQLDVIGVVGAESAEYFTAASDHQAMVREFKDAVGAEIESPEGLLEAVKAGRVNPTTARGRVRKRLSGLFTTVETGYDDLISRAKTGTTVTPMQSSYETLELRMLHQHTQTPSESYHDAMASASGCARMTSEMADQSAATVGELVPDSIKSTAVGAAVGTVVGNVVNTLFFD